MYSKDFLENPVKYAIDLGFKGENIVHPEQEVSLRQERTKIRNANIILECRGVSYQTDQKHIYGRKVDLVW